MVFPSVSVVIPTLNEERNIPHVFERIPESVHQVVLVDGRSIDDTIAVARKLRPDVCVVTQTRKGKGNALACGFEAATGDVIAMIDADGSADPGEIPSFVEALVAGADFAKGTRFLPGGGSAILRGLRAQGNYLLTAFFNLCYHRKYTDLCYGYNVFWRRHLPVLDLDATSELKDDGTPFVGRRVRDRDTHSRARRQGRTECRRGAQFRVQAHSRGQQPERDPRRLAFVWTILAERARSRRPGRQRAPIAAMPTTEALTVKAVDETLEESVG